MWGETTSKERQPKDNSFGCKYIFESETQDRQPLAMICTRKGCTSQPKCLKCSHRKSGNLPSLRFYSSLKHRFIGVR